MVTTTVLSEQREHYVLRHAMEQKLTEVLLGVDYNN